MTDEPKKVPKYARFMLAGFSGMCATVFNQPFDMLKNRMQMSTIGGSTLVLEILRKEGVFELFNGLSAGLLRQATFTTTRLGIATAMTDSATKDDKPPGLPFKALSGIVGGLCGSFVGTPSEVAMIRMTSDGRLPPAERRNYKNVFDALLRISREEGLKHMWTGFGPTMALGAVVNGCQLTTYSFLKAFLQDGGYMEDGIASHFVSSLIAGFVAAAVSMPIDNAKTRLQNMKTVSGTPEYSGAFDVLQKVVKKQGVFSLWNGFVPYYVRLGSHTVLLFIFLEKFTEMYQVHILGDKSRHSGL